MVKQWCSWMDRTARNTATNLARQKARESVLSLDASIGDPKGAHREVEIRMILDDALLTLGFPLFVSEVE